MIIKATATTTTTTTTTTTSKATRMNPISLSRASSAASADPIPLTTGGHSHHRSNSVGTTSSKESAFKNCLKSIPVPKALTEGIQCVRVYANGKTQTQYLTLSQDKFTLYVTTQPLHGDSNASSGKKTRGGGIGVFSSLLRRSPSVGGETNSNNNNNNNEAPTGATSPTGTSPSSARIAFNNNLQKQEIRAIDIGAIYRIQRGNANRRFEMLK